WLLESLISKMMHRGNGLSQNCGVVYLISMLCREFLIEQLPLKTHVRRCFRGQPEEYVTITYNRTLSRSLKGSIYCTWLKALLMLIQFTTSTGTWTRFGVLNQSLPHIWRKPT